MEFGKLIYGRCERMTRREGTGSALCISEYALLLGCLPAVTLLGVWYHSSLVLLAAMLAIAVVALVTVFSERLIPPEVYPFVILAISLALLFTWQLSSERLIMGGDASGEYYVFQLTRLRGFWDPGLVFSSISLTDYNTMLSVTVLPSLLGELLNVESESVFKVLFPLVFSVVPLVLYCAWRQITSARVSLLSAFYFMLMPKFFDSTEMRQMIAELFLALIVYLCLEEKMPGRKKFALLVTFFVGIVVSHYSLAYLLIFFLCFMWVGGWVLKSRLGIGRSLVNSILLLIMVALTFSWYTFANSTPSVRLYEFITGVVKSVVTDFFVPESRGRLFQQLSGAGGSSLLWTVDQAASKLLYFFIAIGIIIFLTRRRGQQIRFDYGLASMVVASMTIMAMIVLLPFFGLGFVTERFLHIVLFFLAPFCVVGGVLFFRAIRGLLSQWRIRPFKKDYALRLVCTLLIVVFLFKTGFIYAVAGTVPISTFYSPLNMDTLERADNQEVRAMFYTYYVPQQDVYSASWLSTASAQKSVVYSDYPAIETLESYGMIDLGRIHSLVCGAQIREGSYVYFRLLNSREGILVYFNYASDAQSSVNMSKCRTQFEWINRIYSNGSGEVDQNQDQYLPVLRLESSSESPFLVRSWRIICE
jgi:uncharacterized membrane protein